MCDVCDCSVCVDFRSYTHVLYVPVCHVSVRVSSSQICSNIFELRYYHSLMRCDVNGISYYCNSLIINIIECIIHMFFIQ